MTVLYSLWQGGESSPSKDTITRFLSGFERTLDQLSRLSEDTSVLQQFTPAQLDPSRLNDLKSAVMANWTDAAPPPEGVSELAGRCVEVLVQQRITEVDRLRQGSQQTVPLSDSLNKGITCLGAMRQGNEALYNLLAAQAVIGDLAVALPQMSEEMLTKFGLKFERSCVAELKELEFTLGGNEDDPDNAKLTPEMKRLADVCLRSLLVSSGAD